MDIRIDTPAVLNGRLFILGVGINDNAFSMVQMMNCENDTRLVVEHIVSLYKSHPKCNEGLNNFESSIISKVLLGNNATAENIKAYYESYALQARPNDYFFFIFNGMSDILPHEKDQSQSQETHLYFFGSISPSVNPSTLDGAN